jgi:hypothetical protein
VSDTREAEEIGVRPLYGSVLRSDPMSSVQVSGTFAGNLETCGYPVPFYGGSGGCQTPRRGALRGAEPPVGRVGRNVVRP